MATLASLVPPVTLLPALEHLSQFSQKIDGRCHTETAVLQHVAVFQLSVFLRFAMLYVCFTAGNHRKKATLASLVPPVTLLPALSVFLRFAMLYVCFTAGNHRKKATLALPCFHFVKLSFTLISFYSNKITIISAPYATLLSPQVIK